MARSRQEIFYVEGMFCEHCERRIEEEVGQVPGIGEVSASFRKGTVRVLMDPEQADEGSIREAVERAGYKMRTAEGPMRGVQIASILIILLGLYLIAQHLGFTRVFNLFPRIEEGLSLGMVFVIGLLTSVHCIAMCGGINLTQSTLTVQSGGRIIRSNLSYNLGRMISYTVIGGIAGAIGGVLSLGGMLRGVVAILAGVIMVLMAMRMLGAARWLPDLHLHLPAGPYRKAAEAGGSSSLVIGLLNGLMPCGPLQAMQIYALSTGNVLTGALSMLIFAAGTIPLMFGFGAFAGKLNQRFSGYMLTVSALLIFVMGIHMVTVGFTLSGIGVPVIGNESPADDAGGGGESIASVDQESPAASLVDGKQTIVTEIDYGSYPSFTVRAGIPVEWTIRVPKGKLNGCNGEILVPAYDLDVVLSEGDTVVAFTPEKPGTIPYSCWMGMIKSKIRVIE